MSDNRRWVLLYTKVHAEAWAEINLRRQGFPTLLPRIRSRGATAPLFPRYVFASCADPHSLPKALHSTLGVQSVVMCGAAPARVPDEIIAEICARMDEHGIVTLDAARDREHALLASRQRERLAALERLAAAGFRVRAA